MALPVFAPVRRYSLIHGILFQMSVIGALTLRELHARFGRHNIGYLWMIGEPLMLATVISTIHHVADYGHQATMEPFPFTVVGYCFFIIFRNTFNRSEGALEGATPLLHHRMVTPFDIMLSKAIVEMTGCIASFILLIGIGIILGIADFPARPLYLMLGGLLIAWWTMGLSFLVGAYTYEGPLLSRLVHPFSYFMVPASGAFFTLSVIPPWIRDYFAWNPMFIMFEIARYGQFEGASDEYIDAAYPIAVCALTTYWGLLALRQVRRRIHVH